MKKLVAMLMAALLLFSCTALAEIEVQEFPEVPENYSEVVDSTNPLKTIYAGAYRVAVTVGEAERSAVVYLAKDYAQTQGFVMVVPATGVSPEQALEEGGWQSVADDYNLYVMVLDTTEAPVDAAFLDAATSLADTRNYWRQPEGRNYFVAYGDNADASLAFVEAYLPDVWAGAAIFGDVTIRAADLENEKGIELPIWLFASEINENEEALIELFKGFNGATDEVFSNAYADRIYFPNQHVNDLLLNDQPISQVRVTVTEDAAALNAERAAYTFDFLRQATREVGYADKTIRYTHDLADWGATVETVEIDGVTRSWVQYVPTELRNTAEGKAPLLLTIHGAALNGEYFAERTEYIKLAEEFGFIIAFPTGSVTKGITPSWSASSESDVKFIATLIDTAKATLPVDESRIYVYGHSMGGLFTQNLIRLLDGTFAASFGTGCAFGYPSESDHQYETPFSIMVGNQDPLSPHGIDNERLRACVDYHVQYNNCGTIEDLDGSYRLGRYSVYVWENDAHVPMVQYFHTEDMPHTATLDGGILMFSWLSQFSRNTDGTVGYRTGTYDAK